VSIEKRRRGDGAIRYRVRWRQGRQNRVRTFDLLRDAQRFESDVRRRKQLGDLAALDAGRQTLDDLARDWWKLHAEPNLARKTREIYLGVWRTYLSPRLGDLRLSEIAPETIEKFVLDLRAAGVGEATITKALVVLQGMMKRGVVWKRVPTNPVKEISKRRPTKARVPSPFPPAAIEAIREQLAIRDGTIVSVLAYAGLRPGEMLSLRWRDIGDRTILVERSISLGEIKETKTRSSRTVKMLAPLVADLGRWRISSGRPPDEALVFPRKDGRPWNDGDWRNWRRRIFKPAAQAVGLPDARPYDLRHSFCSLLLADGCSVVEVARQAGHSPTMTLSTYAHVVEELADGKRASAEHMIRAARAGSVPPVYPYTLRLVPASP